MANKTNNLAGKVSLIIFIFLISAIATFFILKTTKVVEKNTNATKTEQLPTSNESTKQSKKEVGSADTATGRYITYSGENTANTKYSANIIFFYAPWCPECRAFKEAIQAETIPDGTQILEADFDSSTDLKKKYGVTLQSSFVRVDNSGELQSKWVGYGKDKSLNTVLENLE